MGRDHKRRSELLDAMERAVTWYHERLLSRARRRPGARLPALARLRRRRGAPVPPRLGPRRLGRVGQGAQTAREGAVGLGPRLRQPARPAPRTSSAAASCSRSATRRADRSRWAGASCRRGPGQAPPERPEPKYKNSQESPIYSKRRTLYALNWAKQGVIAQGEVVVCEGYTDVIGCFQAGVPWAVATCGTALAEEHFTLLRNFAKRIVLAYDADAAGPERHVARLRVGAQARGRRRGGRSARRQRPGRAGPHRPRGAGHGDQGGPALPPVPGGPHARGRQSLDGRGTGPGGRRGADRGGRAPRRPGAGPVRHAAGGPLPGRRGEAPRAPRIPAARTRRPRARPAAPRGGRATTSRRPWSTPKTTATATGPTSGRGRRPAAALRPGPGLEALKLAVHRPEEVADRVHAVLFADALQRQAFAALVGDDSVHEAVESASPEVANLLRRVIVEEPHVG